MTKLIRGGRVLDPASGRDGTFDLLIENGTVSRIEKSIPSPPPGTEIVDAKGLLVVPGLIDIHTHLREPGHEYKETILTGSQAAAAGGFSLPRVRSCPGVRRRRARRGPRHVRVPRHR